MRAARTYGPSTWGTSPQVTSGLWWGQPTGPVAHLVKTTERQALSSAVTLRVRFGSTRIPGPIVVETAIFLM